MTTVSALNSTDITKIGIGATAGLLIVGFLLSMVLTALVARLIILIVVVGLSVLIWQQRAVIEDHVKKCQLSMSFVGITVHAPKNVVAACNARSR